MSDERFLEIYRQFRSSQDKYVYFMLVAASSAIAFALTRAENRSLSLTLIPWGIALLVWGLSFFFGCMHLLYMSSNLSKNAFLIQVQQGEEPVIGENPILVEVASKRIEAAMERDNKRATSYITWQVLDMYLRTQ
jgi:hypothetical protein